MGFVEVAGLDQGIWSDCILLSCLVPSCELTAAGAAVEKLGAGLFIRAVTQARQGSGEHVDAFAGLLPARLPRWAASESPAC